MYPNELMRFGCQAVLCPWTRPLMFTHIPDIDSPSRRGCLMTEWCHETKSSVALDAGLTVAALSRQRAADDV